MNIAIIVVTFNPSIESLINNIETYIGQIDLIVVVDNSTTEDSQKEIAKLQSHFQKIHVIQNKANLGIAEAQNIGFKYLVNQKGIEFLIEMDQDSSLPQNYVQDIIESYKELARRGKKIACLGPIAINASNGDVYHGLEKNVGVISVTETLSSGLLIKVDTLEKIGYKEAKLFIDMVDWEWCWRASAKGYQTYIDTQLHISHSLGDRHIQFLSFKIGVPSTFRHYYAFRNSLYLIGKKYVPFKWKVKTSILLAFKFIFYPFILPNGYTRSKYMARGIKDFFKSKFGIYQT